MIRSLDLKPRYDSAIRIFRSSAWNLKEAEDAWAKFVAESAPLVKVLGMAVKVTDGVKQSKEGVRIPAVKRMHQESGDSSKPEYINGHLYGAVGVLAEAKNKTYCIPLACEIQDGEREIMNWRYGSSGVRQGSHIRETIVLSYYAGAELGDSILLADRYFFTVPALEELGWLNSGCGDGRRMYMISMMKSNAVAYEKAPARTPGAKGRPRVKGNAKKLHSLFNERAADFVTGVANIYGKKQKVQYLCLDLLWGKGIYKTVRFVLTILDGVRAVLACTDTGIEPLQIIELYSMRFAIEGTFRSMKQEVGSFTNRFWTPQMPKLDRYSKSGAPDRATKVTSEYARGKVLEAFDANERYAFCGVMAIGLLQMLSLKFADEGILENARYQRTPTRTMPSEAVVADVLRKSIFRLLDKHADLPICQKIRSLMDNGVCILEKKAAS